MKKLLALILVVCMVMGLVACTKKPATDPTTPTGTTATVDPNSRFKGKTLQVYGFGGPDSYTDYDSFGKGNYLWMQRAAIDEWATINGVTIKYMGSYNQNQMLAAMASGEKPDLFFQSNNFPTFANYGISSPLTDEEYAEIAEICGTTGYMDLMKYKGVSHGFVVPWVGNILVYYNKTLFENLGVKSPGDYYAEGNWTWSTWKTCMEEVTRDLNGDGVLDIYGCPGDSFGHTGSIRQGDDGRLIAPFDYDYQAYFDSLTLRYETRVLNTWVIKGSNKIQTNVTYPMYAMQSSDCEPYNFEHLYQTIPNGDELRVVPQPKYDGSSPTYKQELSFTQSSISIGALCDEREATMDLVKYILKCGLKYVSDFSLGAVKCEYAGIQGASELSAKWKAAFAEVCADRAEAIKDVPFDQALMDKIYADMANYDWKMYMNYADVKKPGDYSEINSMPPTSSIPAIKEKMLANLQKYNDLYVYD